MANQTQGPQGQSQNIAPERLEPDLTPAPGTQRGGTGGPGGGGSDREQVGFDPDSPDVADPMIDPMHPAKPPTGPAGNTDKRAKGDSYPPYANKQ